MQKVDRRTIKDLHNLFHALDAGKDGYIQKEDPLSYDYESALQTSQKRGEKEKEMV